jgi:hypothetical protein
MHYKVQDLWYNLPWNLYKWLSTIIFILVKHFHKVCLLTISWYIYIYIYIYIFFYANSNLDVIVMNTKVSCANIFMYTEGENMSIFFSSHECNNRSNLNIPSESRQTSFIALNHLIPNPHFLFEIPTSQYDSRSLNLKHMTLL